MTALHRAKRLIRRMIPDPVMHAIRSLGRLDDVTKQFISHNRRTWANWAQPSATAEILVDDFRTPQTLIAYSYFLNVLGRRYSARIKTFSQKARRAPDVAQVFDSFNVREHIGVTLNAEQRARRDALMAEVAPRIKTKRDLLELTVLNVWIGIDIYESYLRDYSQPTVNVSDHQVHESLRSGIGILVFWLDYLRSHEVAAVVVSHDTYAQYDILCKVAYAHQIPVYLPNVRGIFYSDQPHTTWAHMAHYKTLFAELSPEKRSAGLDWAKHQLGRRMTGEVGVDMPYSTRSAFAGAAATASVLRKSDRIKVLIATHCFYDNPHGYGGMLFEDFLEWLRFLGRMSQRTDYDWYLKVHPDPLPGTIKVVREFTREFPKITLLPVDVSHPQLVNEGIDYVLTCYGTVGLEYPLLGVPVINAAYGPTSAFDFNWNATSIEQYEAWLANLAALEKPIDLKDLYACYFMHYNYALIDDLFFDSYRDFTARYTWDQQIGTIAYTHFLERFRREKHDQTIRRIEAFINAPKTVPGGNVCSPYRDNLPTAE